MPVEKGREIKEEGTHKLSRREFIKNAGLMVGGVTLSSIALANACGSTTVTAPGTTINKTVTSTVPGPGATVTITKAADTSAVPATVTVTKTSPVTVTAQTEAAEVAEAVIRLNVNGNEIPVMVRPNWTLQHVLNDKLGLIGAKEWCDAGACGSCSVIVDGRALLSCMMLAIECTGKKIETVEGIAKSSHPLIQAYKNNNCMQCGYCTPGFIVTAKALLDKNKNPSVDQVKDALAGNLCRSSTYPQHARAVQEAAAKGGK
jgi:aerobic-type carbon monoxide dehydrogenase small subunit (CoxS/CutS family)